MCLNVQVFHLKEYQSVQLKIRVLKVVFTVSLHNLLNMNRIMFSKVYFYLEYYFDSPQNRNCNSARRSEEMDISTVVFSTNANFCLTRWKDISESLPSLCILSLTKLTFSRFLRNVLVP